MSDQKMSRFFKLPYGSEEHLIPFSQLADKETSKTLVKSSERDANYFRMLEESGVFLNRAQIKAVRNINGPLLVLAGAGSGKTSVLVCRTGYLVEVGKIDPRNILLMTFSKKAADEMKIRLTSVPGLNERSVKLIEVRTFHSFFLQVLRYNGYGQQILSNEKYKHLILKRKMKDLGISDGYQPESILSMVAHYKMNMKPISDLPENTAAEKELKRLCFFYEDWKKENNWMDFDDVLVEAYHLLLHNMPLLQNLQRRFTYLMVDEFQDTNPLQYELIKLLARPQNHLCVVGDDDQTIYAFQGARNDIILKFHEVFPEVNTVVLSVNYRSSSPIVGLGNAVIQFNKKRKPKVLEAVKKSSLIPLYSRPNTTDEEAEWIVEEIQQKVNQGTHEYKDFAVLYRTANNARSIFEQLTMNEIPFFDYGLTGSSFYEQSAIIPILAYLRFSINLLDFHAFEKILPTLYLVKDRLMPFVHREQIERPKDQLMDHLFHYPDLRSFQTMEIEKRKKLINQISRQKPIDAIKSIRRGFYNKYVETNDKQTATTHKEFIKEQLDELEASAERFETVEDFLHFIKDLNKRHEQMKFIQENADVVKLMTIHKAKGLEFPVVFFIGASEGIIPHTTALEENQFEDKNIKNTDKLTFNEDAIEEERRLAYVAITRAKEELYVSSPALYRGKRLNTSRFILDVFKRKKSKDERKISNAIKANPKLKIKVLAWICTSENCIAWQRISSTEEADLAAKSCPLCGSEMVKGEKSI